MAKRVRADKLLAEQGLAESQEAALRLIMAGQVRLLQDGRELPVDKPGQQLPPDAKLSLLIPERFVSRGAYKLLTAIDHFHLDVTGLVCLDVGASTGGFTDVLLQLGAARVYAVDVGHAQLHERLARDPRVVSLEGVNMRLAPPDLLPEPVDLAVIDVSFISLTHVLPACLRFLKPEASLIALVKPQFELEPHRAVKGVVRDEAARLEAVEKVERFARDSLSLTVVGHIPSTLRGPKGNQEYLLYLRRG